MAETTDGDSPADRHRATPGYRWGVAARHSTVVPVPGRPGWTTVTSDVDYWYLTCGNNLDDAAPERHFGTQEAARNAAGELNGVDVQASLDLSETALVRRQRLKALGETFWARYGEGPVEARWPREPGRYAIEHFSERYGESFWTTVGSLDEVTRDTDRVYDLDEDREVPFTVDVVFERGELAER